jgi:hypothetical protein
MPFDPETFNKVARVIMASSPDEAKIRTAIGRLYYAAHLTAREGLANRGWKPIGQGADHREVIQKLSAMSGHKKDADKLEYLKQLREHADYHLEVTKSALNQACGLCRDIRKRGLAANPVTLWHWQEANDASAHLFPGLTKI